MQKLSDFLNRISDWKTLIEARAYYAQMEKFRKPLV